MRPIEGFQTLKFFRSPLWAGLYGLLLAPFTTSYPRRRYGRPRLHDRTLETYKTFFFPSKPRGKFAGKPILFPEMLRAAEAFAVLYAGIWALMITGFVLAYRPAASARACCGSEHAVTDLRRRYDRVARRRQRLASRRRLRWSSASSSARVASRVPQYRRLVGYGLYAIPAHLLISFLPNDPLCCTWPSCIRRRWSRRVGDVAVLRPRRSSTTG